MNWLTAEKKWGMLLTYCFDYFPSCSLSLSLSVWLQRTLPWGTFSSLRLMDPTESDDGPIMWVRPGEQMIPVADIPKSPFKRKRWVRLETVHKFIKPICWILLKRCAETETELAGMNVVCTGCKSQWCVCVCVCTVLSQLCTLYSPHSPWGPIMKNSTQTHSRIWSSSRGSSMKLCCSRAAPDEAITPSLFVSVTVSLLLTHKLCLSLTHTHMIPVREPMRERECVCLSVFVCGMWLTTQMRSSLC